jgi:hypothetical protein
MSTKIMFTGKNHSQALSPTDETSLASISRKMGFLVVDSLDEKPAVVICVDFEKHASRVIKKANSLGLLTVLVMNEPAVVIPEHGNEKILRDFQIVLKVGRPNSAPQILWPQSWQELNETPARVDRAVIVNADKWSFIKGQLYWLRSGLAARDRRVDVFGHGWNRSFGVRLAHRIYEILRTINLGVVPRLKGSLFLLAKPISFLGPANLKVQVMKKYKVAVVIENSAELVTEKLFDAWFAGCIPVYVGPALRNFSIPGNLIVVPTEASVSAVSNAISEALRMDHGSFISNLREFLDSEPAQLWDADRVMPGIVRFATSAVNPN